MGTEAAPCRTQRVASAATISAALVAPSSQGIGNAKPCQKAASTGSHTSASTAPSLRSYKRVAAKALATTVGRKNARSRRMNHREAPRGLQVPRDVEGRSAKAEGVQPGDDCGGLGHRPTLQPGAENRGQPLPPRREQGRRAPATRACWSVGRLAVPTGIHPQSRFGAAPFGDTAWYDRTRDRDSEVVDQGDGRPLHSRRPQASPASTHSAMSVQMTIRVTARP